MKLLVLSTLLAVALSNNTPFDSELNTQWENFKRVYKKQYTATEEGARRYTWESNVREIMHHNLAADMENDSYTKGINEYSDLSPDEFLTRMRCINVENDMEEMNGSSWLAPSNVKYPSSVDWRKSGLVTGVKNQRNCGSCWAFAATGCLEGQHKKKTGRLVSLSEQNLVDCDKKSSGCEGGRADKAYNYIRRNGGINTESSYPYEAKDNACRFRKYAIGATVTGYEILPRANETALAQAVATIGPISVSIHVSRSFHHYKRGVFNDRSCGQKPNHAVLVVGYGNEYGRDYWLVKNSWGTTWGEGGYIKMSRNKNNQCFIAGRGTYPLV